MQPNAVDTNVSIPWPLEMSLMLATEGDSDKTVTHPARRYCFEGTGARGRAPNEGKPTIGAVVEYKINPYCETGAFVTLFL